MDKKVLNNEVVRLRKFVKKAKIRTINKLTRLARELKSKNGTDEIKEKYQKKAERYLQEVFSIKKLKPDDVTKFLLCNTKALPELLADTTLSMDARGMAKLGMHEDLKCEIEKFHNKLPSWDIILPVLFEDLGMKRKLNTKAKPNAKKDSLGNKSSGKKVKMKQQVTGSDCHDSTTKWQVDPVDTKSQKLGKIQNETQGFDHQISKVEKLPEQLSSDSEEKVISNVRTSKKKSIKIQSSNSGIAEVKRFTELLAEKSEEKLACDVVEDIEKPVAVPTTVDSFFFNDDGESEYLSLSCVPETLVEEPFENNVDLSKNKRYFIIPRDKENGRFSSKPTNKPFVKGNDKRFPIKQHRYQSKPECKTHFIPSTEKECNANVHPSWEAKRKLKEQQQVQAFQGKKIKFED